MALGDANRGCAYLALQAAGSTGKSVGPHRPPRAVRRFFRSRRVLTGGVRSLRDTRLR